MPRILVADDNSNIQKMVALAFEEQGIDVVAVGNGEAAVRRIPDLNPDIVLADVFMPVRTGYEVCEFVKKDPRFSKVPVILLVGAFDPLDENEAKRVGADGVLKKPFVPPDPLIAMVNEALGKLPKPEAPKFEAPIVEIPKPAPPAPIIERFPEPAEGEEVYAFGTGRRSLEDDEASGGAQAESNKLGKAPAATREEEPDEEETRAGWRRRVEVDFDEVPKFAAQLVADLETENAATPAIESGAASAVVETDSQEKVEEAPVIVTEPEPETSVVQEALSENRSWMDALTSAPATSQPSTWNSEYTPSASNETSSEVTRAVERESSAPEPAPHELQAAVPAHAESSGESFFAPDPEVFHESTPALTGFHGDVTDFSSAPLDEQYVTSSSITSPLVQEEPPSSPVSAGKAETRETSELAAAGEASPAPTANVDDVVAKVLEKLGPQLQELLSKGVRPVVEDLMHQNPDSKKK